TGPVTSSGSCPRPVCAAATGASWWRTRRRRRDDARLCDPALGPAVTAQDAPGDGPDPGQGCQRGVRDPPVQQEAGGPPDRQDAEVGGGERGGARRAGGGGERSRTPRLRSGE